MLPRIITSTPRMRPNFAAAMGSARSLFEKFCSLSSRSSAARSMTSALPPCTRRVTSSSATDLPTFGPALWKKIICVPPVAPVFSKSNTATRFLAAAGACAEHTASAASSSVSKNERMSTKIIRCGLVGRVDPESEPIRPSVWQREKQCRTMPDAAVRRGSDDPPHVRFGLCRQRRQRFLIWSPCHAVLANNGRYVARGRHVERGILHANVFRRDRHTEHLGHFIGRALLYRDLIARVQRQVERGDRGGHVERHAVLFRQHGNGICADFVGDVSIGSDAVGAHHHTANFSRLQKMPGH